jgi:E3 ubiquitin-protein ligase DOA10
MQQTCLFCLDPIKENTLNPIGCQCTIYAHQSCFHLWFQQKQQLECPICHTIAIPNPLSYENVRVVYVESPEQRTMERNIQRRFRNQEKAIAMCCCVLFGWSIGLTILELVFGKG